MKKKIVYYLMIVGLFYGCSAEDPPSELVDSNAEEPEVEAEEPEVEIESKEPVGGIRIAWDYRTLKEISDADNHGYNGYARMVQLNDGSLLAVYESNGDVLVKKSKDYGDTWGEAITVASYRNGINMATPDIVELEDNSILVSYNPRPTGNASPTSRFAIRTIKSYDGGLTWKDDELVYEADSNFANGAWEPSAVQLPDGEIQLFFSNESPYRSSGEQNISLMRSYDNGITWTETPEIASFTKGSRDGMPSPLLLKNGNEIVVSIEDNSKYGKFRPYIIRSTLEENWNETVGGDSPNRNYALKEELASTINAAAPYLTQLNTGETLLSYQGTEGRYGGEPEMKVVIGNDRAFDFNRKSVPFPIESDEAGLWNSIAVLEDNTVIALTTTRAFSNSPGLKVWMIKGYVIPEVEAEELEMAIDGRAGEELWDEQFPVFVGGQGNTQLYSNFSYDEDYLYVLTKVKDDRVVSGSSGNEGSDAVTIYLDPQNRSYISPGPGIFRITVTANNEVTLYEGDNNHYSGWTKISGDIKARTEENSNGYFQEIAIPWDLLGGKPESDKRIGFNIELTERGGDKSYDEDISFNDPKQPYTWSTVRLSN